MINPADTYKIGSLTRTHGLRGELQFVFTDDIFDRADADHLLVEVDGILTPFYIEEYRFRSDSSALILFEDINTVEAAQPLVGCDVYVERSLAGDAPDEEPSLRSLIGFHIQTEEGTEVGEIVDIDDQTENLLFVVEHGEREVLIPAHEELITQWQPDARRIVMRLPDGLLEL